MNELKIGDIVARKSYNYDVLFRVQRISSEMVDLVGINVRILADAPIYDLKKISKEEASRQMLETEKNNRTRLNRTYNGLNNRFNIRNTSPNTNVNTMYTKESIYKKPGIVLHIDGDSHLSNLKKSNNTNTSEQVIFSHI